MEGGPAGDWRRLPLPSNSSNRQTVTSSRRNSAEVLERLEHLSRQSRSTTSLNQQHHPHHHQNPANSNSPQQQAVPEEEDDGRLISAFVQMQELSKLLECPVCYEIALPPVIMCTSGHNICSDCRKQVHRCPVCRSSFCEARNRLAESIVEKCSVACKHRSSGCPQVMNGSRMALHVELECEFRPIICRDCRVKIPYEEYISHLLNVEKLPKQLATECSTGFDIDEDDFLQSLGGSGQSWEPTWLHCYNMDFFCHLECVSNFWCIYVIGFAPDDILQNYLCDILVWNRDKQQEFRFHGPIHSYRKSGGDILATGQCLITSESSIRSILNEGGIDVVVCIVLTNSYRAPTSRNTGQSIYSPLTLRGNSNNDGVTTTGTNLIITDPVNGLRLDSNNNNNNNTTNNQHQDIVEPQHIGTSSSSGFNNNNNNNNEFNSDPEDETPVVITSNGNNQLNRNPSPTVPVVVSLPPQPPPRQTTSSAHQQQHRPHHHPTSSEHNRTTAGPSRHYNNNSRASRNDRQSNNNNSNNNNNNNNSRAPPRSRSLDGVRRLRRHHRHNNNNNSNQEQQQQN